MCYPCRHQVKLLAARIARTVSFVFEWQPSLVGPSKPPDLLSSLAQQQVSCHLSPARLSSPRPVPGTLAVLSSGFSPTPLPPGFSPTPLPPGFCPAPLPPGFCPAPQPLASSPALLPSSSSPALLLPIYSPALLSAAICMKLHSMVPSPAFLLLDSHPECSPCHSQSPGLPLEGFCLHSRPPGHPLAGFCFCCQSPGQPPEGSSLRDQPSEVFHHRHQPPEGLRLHHLLRRGILPSLVSFKSSSGLALPPCCVLRLSTWGFPAWLHPVLETSS